MIPLFLGTLIHSMAYGATFLLPLRAISLGTDEGYVGEILLVGMIAAILSGFCAARFANRLPILIQIVVAGAAQGGAFLIVTLLPETPLAILLSGLGFGVGWAVFYILTPILAVQMFSEEARVRCLTLVSGTMMFGIGAGPAVGNVLVESGWPVERVLQGAGAMSLIAAGTFATMRRGRHGADQDLWKRQADLTLQSAKRLLTSDAALPIVMIALGGSIFGCLTNYQSAIAAHFGVGLGLFFTVFVIIVVTARFFFALFGTRLPMRPLIVALTVCTAVSLFGFWHLVEDSGAFLVATAFFAVGYGLSYSVLNGIVAHTRHQDLVQAGLLLFPLAYFAGLYGFPFVGSRLLLTLGVHGLLGTLTALAILQAVLAILVWAGNSWLSRSTPGLR